MFRLVRLLRLLVAFEELYVLVIGIAKAGKTLAWASLLVFLAANVWAIVSVEFLQPRVVELSEKGFFDDCFWCPTASHEL